MKTIKSSFTNILCLIAASTIFFLASSALANERDNSTTNTMGLGIHSGMNYSNFQYTKDSVNYMKSSKTGVLWGVHFEDFTPNLLAYRIEANYSSKGYNLDQFSSITHNYLQIPLLFKVSPLFGPFKVFAEAGPAVSLLLSDTVEVVNSSGTVSDDSSSWDLSVIAGLGVGLKLDNFIVEVEGRYDYGLKSLNNSDSINVKSRAFQTVVGVTFFL